MRKILLAMVWGGMCAAAAPISLSGAGTYGTFTGSIEYFGGIQTLVLTLNNTTAVYGGYITGIALNIPGDSVASIGLASSDPDFILIGGLGFSNTVNAAPYGDFDFGASLASNWEGSGPPFNGIPVGGSATFTFTMTGLVAGLTTQSFLDALSVGPGTPEAIMVRFRGLTDGTVGVSDKVPADPDQPLPNPIPEPGTFGLIGAGLASAALWRRLKS